jgi:hypothetical protein
LAIPRVFISSTCYDLKHIRENLKYFVKTVGYEPVLSEDGGVYYSVDKHTHDSCLAEVANCQFFILIIGGRYGSKHLDKDTSITNNEYKEAVRNRIPIFALVDSATLSDYYTYSENLKKNPQIVEIISYPNSDNVKIFSFIDEVKKNSTNNAIAPFSDFTDMEGYLKKQWAGMVYELLAERLKNDSANETNGLIEDLKGAVEKSEQLIKMLLRSTDKEHAEDTINKVDLNADALSFSRQIQNKFNRLVLDNTTIDDLMGIDIEKCKTWPEFLDKTEDYRIVTSEVASPDWLSSNLPLAFTTFVYVDDDDSPLSKVGIWDNNKINFDTARDKNIQKAFEALKLVDEQTRRQILSEIAIDRISE